MQEFERKNYKISAFCGKFNMSKIFLPLILSAGGIRRVHTHKKAQTSRCLFINRGLRIALRVK